ncbi:MAG: response regulator [Sulfuricella sp.]|jgi:FixJ family two-component response regulator
MIPTDSIVFIVDDDEAVRDSLALLLSLNGFATRVFDSAEHFLAACQPEWAGCLVLDIRMQGMDGLELQRTLNARNVRLPIIVITAHGDVAMAREALKAGAVDFLEKPIDDQLLIANVSIALDRNLQERSVAARSAEREQKMARLTTREREVMLLVAAGKHAREIAAELNISPRTVEVYKARMMEKLQVRNVPELIRVVLDAENAFAKVQVRTAV